MGNPTGINWITKTKAQKEQDIQKHFFKSPFPELERRIKQLEFNIKDCKEKIGRYKLLIRPLNIKKETLCTKNKAEETKKKIKQIQKQITSFRIAKSKNKKRKRDKKIKKWLEYEKELLTEDEMIDIIKYGTIYMRKNNGRRILGR